MRRGGYGDAGKSTSNGALPVAPPVQVPSEEHFRDEIELIASKLQPVVEWNQRVDALLRLESLTLGGAGNLDNYAECLIAVREPLISQVLERRSAVSRQACHVLSVAVQAGGNHLEALAVQLLPVLLKAIAMGIQVVTDAADACARAVVCYCQSPKMLPRLCSTITLDKNGKLRQCASNYLLQITEQWEPTLLEKHSDVIESAILAAAQDAHSDTRAAGRHMFAIYGSVWPARSSAMLHRIDKDKPLQDKLLQALETNRPGKTSSESSFDIPQQAISRRSSFGHSDGQPGTPRGSNHAGHIQTGPPSNGAATSLGPRPAGKVPAPVPKLALSSLSGAMCGRGSPTGHSMPSLPNSARLPISSSGVTPRAAAKQAPTSARYCRMRDAENLRPNTSGTGSSTPRILQSTQNGTDHYNSASEGLKVHQSSRAGVRKSMGGAALRISIATAAQEQETVYEDGAPTAAKLQTQQGNLTARRLAAPPAPPLSARARRQSAWPPSSAPYCRADTARRVEADSCTITEASDSNTELTSCSSWEERVPAAALVQLLAQVSKAGTSWVDRVHLFGSIGEMLHGAGNSPHPEAAANADRLAACLLEGAGDAHFKVAAAALEAINEGLNGRNSMLFEPQLDRLMPILFLRSVDPKDQLKQLARTALAECPKQHAPEAVLAALSKSLQQSRAPKVKCAVLEYFVAVATGLLDLEDHLELAPGPALRTLVAAMMHLVLDKNHDIRRAAIRALEVIYRAEQGQFVLSAMQSLPPVEGAAAQRALASVVPSIESDVAASMRASRPAPVASVCNAAAPTESSRRHSGEGLLRLPDLPPQVLTARGPAKLPPTAVLPRASGKSGALPSPRSASPGRMMPGDASPCAASPTMSRLGRQASSLSLPSREADPITAAQLSRQPSSCVTHTSSPAASPPISRTASMSAAAAVAAGSPHQLSPLGRAASEPPVSEAKAPARGLGPASAVDSTLRGTASLPSSMSDLAPFDDIMEGQLRRLLVQLQVGPSTEGFQGLTRMAHVLPASAWTSHFSQVLSALMSALASTSPLLRESGLMLIQGLAAVRPDLFVGPLPVLLPGMLGCMVDSSREVVVAADEALAQLLGALPTQPSLALLTPSLPSPGEQLTADAAPGGLLYGTLKNLRRVVQRMSASELQQALLPDLVPGLCASYCSPIADVRKATVDCLVSIWLGVGTSLELHLAQLSMPQMKLLTIYRDKAMQQRSMMSPCN